MESPVLADVLPKMTLRRCIEIQNPWLMKLAIYTIDTEARGIRLTYQEQSII